MEELDVAGRERVLDYLAEHFGAGYLRRTKRVQDPSWLLSRDAAGPADARATSAGSAFT